MNKKRHGDDPHALPRYFYKRKLLCRKRRPAPTRPVGVGIHKFKPRTVQAIHIIDYRAIHILLTDRIKKEFDPVLLNHRVIFTRAFVKTEIVLKSGAPSAHNGNAQTAILHTFACNDFSYFLY